MKENRYNKKIILYIVLSILFIKHFKSITYAGELKENEIGFMYLNDYDEIARDTWVWIDTDKDSIAECYRFDEDGHLSLNYKDRYGKETNDKGQLIENGEIVRKMLSSGEILKNKETPTNGIIEFIGNIINPKPKYEKDKWTKKEANINIYETNSVNETIDGKVLYAKSHNNEVEILNGESADVNIIYANGTASEINDEIKDENKIILGKDFRKFISSKNKCTEKVRNVYIYGGENWTDVLALNGNGASVKFTLDDNNYVYFEVAHDNKSVEDKDSEITLDMYVDNILVDSFDDFVDGKPQVVEEYLDNAKTVELKSSVKSNEKVRNIYIRNGRFRKLKSDP